MKTNGKKKTKAAKPDFSRVPEADVRRGVKMLRAGQSASYVMREVGVSYPTVLKWKREFVSEKQQPSASPAPDLAQVLDNSRAEPLRRTLATIDPAEVLRQVTEALMAGCEVTLMRDRDRFIARLSDNRTNSEVYTQNSAPPLAMIDVVGKWHREVRHNGHAVETPAI